MDVVGALIVLISVSALFYLVNHIIVLLHNQREEVQRLRRERDEELTFLNSFSKKLGAVEEIDDAMELVARHICEIMDLESCGIYVPVEKKDKNEARHRLRGAACTGYFPVFGEDTPMRRKLLENFRHRVAHFRRETIDPDEGVIGRVAVTGTALLIPDAAAAAEFKFPPGIRTLIAVPMFVEERFVGVICAINGRAEERRFNEDDLATLKGLSVQAALASNLVLVYSERSRQERMVRELEFGRELQQSLLPNQVPYWGSYRFATYGSPALEVAGDYYDYIEMDENRIMVLVADATGKGVPACMLMAMCSSFVRCLVENYRNMEDFLYEINRKVYTDTDEAHFVTMGVLVINRITHVCEYGCAGHTPLLMRSADGKTMSIKPKGFALGLFPSDFGIAFETLSFCFEPGMQLLLFSDGITEALNNNDEEFGEDRLAALWREHSLPPEQIGELITQQVHDFAGSRPQADDQTLMVVERAPAENDRMKKTEPAPSAGGL
jgi:sigma-B regulation protein RsbU (phosphoserine phosphatase)